MRRGALLAPLVLLAASTASDDAEAFSTRVHIMLANRVRDAAVDGDGTITLWQGGHSVTLSQADSQAIIEEPEAFRAGAIGPDNMIFPGMTDPSHAIRQRPFEQCERLYDAAVLAKERAYALGCFLHGSTDAIAHHYVNHMTGETFTLTPITSGRETSYKNVVRHIISEDMIQDAAYSLAPEQFTGDKLAHEIPKGFVLRTYFDLDSDVYALMGAHAIGAYNQYIEDNPGSSLPEVMLGVDAAPAEQLVLLPVYVEQIHLLRAYLKTYLEEEVAIMQDWDTPEGNQLQVLEGNDGVLGTKDDDVLCDVSCPSLFAKYFIFTGLLAPRYDAGGNELPPAWDKVSDKFGEDLDDLLPSLVDTIENVSARLNTGLDEGGGGIGDIVPSDLQADFSPMTDWADRITTIDTESIATAVSPQWLLDLQNFFQNAGINVDIAAWIEAILEPILQPIRDGIRDYIVGQALTFIDDLTAEYQEEFETTHDEYTSRLAAVKPPGVSGVTSLDHFYESGLYGHAFNVTAVALAKREAVLPIGNDPVGVGPASFDCSHTTKWMQVGACDYLARVVFPLGQEVSGALSIKNGDQFIYSPLDEDAPIECHDGSLVQFTTSPSAQNCGLVTLDDLLDQPRGTVSRAHPPELDPNPVECTNLEIEGLPDPPEGSGGNGSGAGGPGTGGDGEGGGGEDDSVADGDDEGCDCRAAPRTSGLNGAGLIAAAFGIALWSRRSARRQRARRAAAIAAATLALGAGCGDDDGPSTGGSTTEGGAPSDGGAGAGGSPSNGGAPQTSSSMDGAGGEGGEFVDHSQELIDALSGTRWSALLDRDGRDRAYELWFSDEDEGWAEIRNPFGPSRIDVGGEYAVEPDGETLHAVDDASGDVRTWRVEIVPGNPRTLELTDEEGAVEVFSEGLWPYPTEGLTAELRVFQSSGLVADAYCKAGSVPCGIDYNTLFDFARGEGEAPLDEDIVAGARLLRWYNVSNFAVTDVNGFDFDTFGGTELSDQYNFTVRYTGWIENPTGGTFTMREADDDVGEWDAGAYGGVWTFLGNDVGEGGFSDLFLGVNAFGFCTEGSNDEPIADPTGPGLVAVEIIMIRCNAGGPFVDVYLKLGNGQYQYVGNQPTDPDVSLALFPEPF